MFSSSGVVLKIREIKDRVFLVSLLTKDYWKIHAWIKWRKTFHALDIGSYITCKIQRKWESNILQEYAVKVRPQLEWLSYECMHDILEYLSHIHTLVPENVPYPFLVSDYVQFLGSSTSEISTLIHLLSLKLVDMYGISQTTPDQDITNLQKNIRTWSPSKSVTHAVKRDILRQYVHGCLTSFLHHHA